MYVGQNESVKLRLSILNGLKNRGVEDILIACVDGLICFNNIIETVFPDTEIQQCILIRSGTQQNLLPTRDSSCCWLIWNAYMQFHRTGRTGYLWWKMKREISYWLQNRERITRWIFRLISSIRKRFVVWFIPQYHWRFNQQLRKFTKSKTVFPFDDSLLKMLYLAMIDITKKQTRYRQDWRRIHSQLEIFFEKRLSGL